MFSKAQYQVGDLYTNLMIDVDNDLWVKMSNPNSSQNMSYHFKLTELDGKIVMLDDYALVDINLILIKKIVYQDRLWGAILLTVDGQLLSVNNKEVRPYSLKVAPLIDAVTISRENPILILLDCNHVAYRSTEIHRGELEIEAVELNIDFIDDYRGPIFINRSGRVTWNGITIDLNRRVKLYDNLVAVMDNDDVVNLILSDGRIPTLVNVASLDSNQLKSITSIVTNHDGTTMMNDQRIINYTKTVIHNGRGSATISCKSDEIDTVGIIPCRVLSIDNRTYVEDSRGRLHYYNGGEYRISLPFYLNGYVKSE